MTGNDREDILELLAANEKLGAALYFAYQRHPELKEEIKLYLADYPFECQCRWEVEL